MNELLMEVYALLMERDNDAKKTLNTVNAEMEKLLIPYKSQLTEEEWEKLHYLAYDIAFIAEREATLYGMKFLLKLLLEL